MNRIKVNVKPEKTHIDLFSGIGGFALACEWAGIKAEVFCEKDKRCQEFLQRTYPGIPVVSDIKEFDGTKWRGRYLLTAGVPCQPASRAGKQRGKDDDRWLWPEAIRVIGEAKPSWCLLENPPGIGDVGLEGILAGLENEGYEVRVFGIPACAVNSPQLRNRYWIVANCSGLHEMGIKLPMGKEWGKKGRIVDTWDLESHMADRCGARLEKSAGERGDVEPKCAAVERGALCDMADTGEQRGGPWGTESEGQFGKDEVAEFDGDVADTETTAGIGFQDREEFESPTQDGRCNAYFWRNSVWLPCFFCSVPLFLCAFVPSFGQCFTPSTFAATSA